MDATVAELTSITVSRLINRTSLNIVAHVFWCTHALISFGFIFSSEIAWFHSICLCYTLIENTSVLKWLYKTVLLAASWKVLVSLHPHQHLVLVVIQNSSLCLMRGCISIWFYFAFIWKLMMLIIFSHLFGHLHLFSYFFEYFCYFLLDNLSHSCWIFMFFIYSV